MSLSTHTPLITPTCKISTLMGINAIYKTSMVRMQFGWYNSESRHAPFISQQTIDNDM